MRANRVLPMLAVAGTSMLIEGCACRNEVPDTGSPVVEGPAHDIGQYLALDVLDGEPVAAYYDRTDGALVFAMGTLQGEEVTWEEEEVDGFAVDGLDVGDRGRYTDMLIDGSTVWLSYYDATNGNLFVAKRNGADDWETMSADSGGGSAPHGGRFTSIAMGADGQPMAAHYDVGKKQLRVARYNGSGWAGSIVDEGEGVPADSGVEAIDSDVGKYAKVLVDGNTEYIAYYDAAWGDLKLAVGSGSSWDIYVVDGAESDVGLWPNLLMDGGELLIAYQDATNWDLKLARGTPGGEWTTEIIDDGEFVGSDAELYMNGSYPAAIYFDGSQNDMKRAEFNGSEWTVDYVAGEDAALGFHNETITVGGTRYVGCYDYTNRTLWFESL